MERKHTQNKIMGKKNYMGYELNRKKIILKVDYMEKRLYTEIIM